MPQFDLSVFIPQIFWLFITFSVLMLVMFIKIAPKIRRGIDDRNRHLNDIFHKKEMYLEEIKILTKNIDQMKIHHDQLMNAKITSFKHQFSNDKERQLMETQEKLGKKRKEAIEIYQANLKAIDQEIPVMIKDLAILVQNQILITSSRHRKSHHGY